MPPITIPNTGHLDAGETLFLETELTHIMARIFEQRFPVLKGRLMFPVNNEAGAGVEFITWHELDYVGVAMLIADYSTNLPRADAYMKPNQVKVRKLGDAYGYSIDDIQKAARAKKPLQVYKATAARKAMEQKVDTLAFFGDTAMGLVGILSHPNIPVYTVANSGTGGSTTFASKTPAQIIYDVSNFWVSIKNLTKEAEAPNTLALPTVQYSLLATTQLPNTTVTLLDFLKKNLEGCEAIISSGRLAAANGGGLDGNDVMLAYDRDPGVVELHIPVEFMQLPPQLVALEYVINCLMDFAGLIVYRPLALAIAEGI